MPNVTASFIDDLAEHHRDMLLAAGYTLPDGTADSECTELYHLARFRSIPPRLRRVHEAADLRCPAGTERAYEALKLKVIAGENLNPHLSRQLMRAGKQDRLLTQWGIQHFHPGFKVNKNGFLGGDDMVLFARVTPTDVYFCYFGPHDRLGGGANTGFIDLQIIESLKRNWPETLEPLGLRGASNFSLGEPDKTQTQEQRAQTTADVARSTNLMFPAALSDGSAYLLGVWTMSGLPWTVARSVDDSHSWAWELEERVRASAADEVAKALASGVPTPDDLRLKLLFEAEGKPFVQELGTRVVIEVPQGRTRAS